MPFAHQSEGTRYIYAKNQRQRQIDIKVTISQSMEKIFFRWSVSGLTMVVMKPSVLYTLSLT